MQEKTKMKGDLAKSGPRKVEHPLQISIEQKGSHTVMTKDELVLGLWFSSIVSKLVCKGLPDKTYTQSY